MLLLGASENLRQAIGTSVKLRDAVMDVLAVGRFYQGPFNVSPCSDSGVGGRMVVRLRELNGEKSGASPYLDGAPVAGDNVDPLQDAHGGLPVDLADLIDDDLVELLDALDLVDLFEDAGGCFH